MKNKKLILFFMFFSFLFFIIFSFLSFIFFSFLFIILFSIFFSIFFSFLFSIFFSFCFGFFCFSSFFADDHIICLQTQEGVLRAHCWCGIDSQHADKKGEHTSTHCHTALLLWGRQLFDVSCSY